MKVSRGQEVGVVWVVALRTTHRKRVRKERAKRIPKA